MQSGLFINDVAIRFFASWLGNPRYLSYRLGDLGDLILYSLVLLGQVPMWARRLSFKVKSLGGECLCIVCDLGVVLIQLKHQFFCLW